MKTINYAIFVGLLASVGCLDVSVNESSVCDTQSVNFGTLPPIPANTLPNQSVPVSLTSPEISYDFSDAVNKVSDVASNLQVAVNELTIDNSSHDLDWVTSVDIQVQGSASDGSTPQVELGHADASLSVHVTMDSATLLHYLQSGKVMLTFTVNGNVSSSTTSNATSVSNDVNMCVAVSANVTKKL